MNGRPVCKFRQTVWPSLFTRSKAAEITLFGRSSVCNTRLNTHTTNCTVLGSKTNQVNRKPQILKHHTFQGPFTFRGSPQFVLSVPVARMGFPTLVPCPPTIRSCASALSFIARGRISIDVVDASQNRSLWRSVSSRDSTGAAKYLAPC